MHKDKDGLSGPGKRTRGGDEEVEVVLGVGREGREGVVVIGEIPPREYAGRRRGLGRGRSRAEMTGRSEETASRRRGTQQEGGWKWWHLRAWGTWKAGFHDRLGMARGGGEVKVSEKSDQKTRPKAIKTGACLSVGIPCCHRPLPVFLKPCERDIGAQKTG